MIEDKLMKRTRAVAKNKIEKDNVDTITKTQTTPVALKKLKLNFKSLQNTKNAFDTMDAQTAHSKRSKSSQKEIKTETHIEKTEKVKEDFKPNASSSKGKLRVVMGLQMMKAELSQLEDPPITPWEKELSSSRLQYEFFDIPCKDLAQQLLGKILVRYLENGTVLKGRIVETEAYLGAIDKASHSYQNKVTPRNLPMYMPPVKVLGDGCAVLVRAVDPLEGVECMADQRTSKTKKTSLKPHELCNGPSKLCMAYQLNKQHSKYSLCTWKSLWIEDYSALEDIKIIKSARIGIDSCGPEWANKPLRYYVYGNKSVSKRDKKAEMEVS